jgi:hypothetical protein
MTLRQHQQKLLDAAIIWHAATVLSGQRPSKADAYLHKIACRYLRAKATGRKR